MSFFEKAKNLVSRANSSVPEHTDSTHTATPPAYVIPAGFEVKQDPGWLVVHHGLNRKERRKLEYQASHANPTEPIIRKGFQPIGLPLSQKKIKKRLAQIPDNFPVRRAEKLLQSVRDLMAPDENPEMLNRKSYCFEPEFWQLVELARQFKTAQEAKAKDAVANGAEVLVTPKGLMIGGELLPQHA